MAWPACQDFRSEFLSLPIVQRWFAASTPPNQVRGRSSSGRGTHNGRHQRQQSGQLLSGSAGNDTVSGLADNNQLFGNGVIDDDNDFVMVQAFELNDVSKTSKVIGVLSIRKVLSFFEFNDEISLPVTSNEQLVIYGIGDGVLTQSSSIS